MKQCPACKANYSDDTLSFCLSDGNPLIDIADDEPTVVRPAARDALRVDLSAGVEPTVVPKPEPPHSGSSTKWIKIVVAAVILFFAALAALGLAGVVFYSSMGGAAATPTPTPVPPTPKPTATSTPDLEKERLKDEIANIQKRLEEQKKNANTWDRDETDDERGSAITATVDSPNDGFLALRNKPDPDRGERIAKIPHGAEVEIMNCEKTAVTIDGRSGRWCQIEYEGQNGWVFDAWLEY